MLHTMYTVHVHVYYLHVIVQIIHYFLLLCVHFIHVIVHVHVHVRSLIVCSLDFEILHIHSLISLLKFSMSI